ncbi:MAG: hypothetical protein AB7E61_06090 [Acholeplasmataceae bacterium]
MNKPLLKYHQLKTFHDQLKISLDEIHEISFIDGWICINEKWIRYQISRYDIETNYSAKQNTLYINPRQVNNPTVLWIKIKNAYRYIKNIPILTESDIGPFELNK